MSEISIKKCDIRLYSIKKWTTTKIFEPKKYVVRQNHNNFIVTGGKVYVLIVEG